MAMEERSTFLQGVHQMIDLVLVVLAFWVAYWLRRPAQDIGINYNVILLLALICSHLSLRLNRVYVPLAGTPFRIIAIRVVKAVLLSLAAVVFLLYLLHIADVSRLLLVYFTVLLVVLLIGVKAVFYYTLKHNLGRVYISRTVLVIGSRDRAVELIENILAQPGLGIRLLGCLETIDNQAEVGRFVSGTVRVIGTMDGFNDLLMHEPVDEVIWALPLKKVEEVHNYIFFAEHMGVRQRILPDFQIQRIRYYPATSTINVDQFLGMPTLSLFSTPYQETALLLKTVMDYAGAGFGLLVLSPLLLGIAVLIKCTSRGPVLFSHIRCGLNGRKFAMYKFRTMVEGAESMKDRVLADNEMDGPVFKIKDDPRITPVGRFLRRTSLDELPQLFNVLRGEMSLVGPRPPLPDEVEKYSLWQRRRLSMKPGLTCIWQVSGRNDISFDYWMKMDLEYIDNWSLWLDVKLLVLTLREVALGGGH